jgi:hypothetical protein
MRFIFLPAITQFCALCMDAKKTTTDWRDKPEIWFSLLCHSLAVQDFARAAKAKKELERLGIDVSFRLLPNAHTEFASAEVTNV